MLAARRVAGERLLTGHPRRPAELAHAHHQRRVQQAALLQVGQQRGEALIEPRQQPVFQGRENVVVGVPAVGVVVVGRPVLAANAVVPQDGDVGHARLDEPPAEQTGLAGAVSAVGVADGFRLLPQVERPAEARRRQKIIRLSIERVHLPRGRPRTAGAVFQRFEQGTPAFQAGGRQVRRRIEAGDSGVPGRHVAEQQRLAGGAEDAGVLSRRRQQRGEDRPVDVDGGVGQPPGRPQPAHHGPESGVVVGPRRRVGRLQGMEASG